MEAGVAQVREGNPKNYGKTEVLSVSNERGFDKFSISMLIFGLVKQSI
jgi:hypothetical protein